MTFLPEAIDGWTVGGESGGRKISTPRICLLTISSHNARAFLYQPSFSRVTLNGA